MDKIFSFIGGLLKSGIIAGALLFLLVLTRNPVGLKAQFYDWTREGIKKSMELKTYNWYSLEGDNFKVKYQPVDAPIARLVLETAEESFQDVNNLLDYKPSKKVSIFVYPNRFSLNKSFGWDGAVDAMGVYWAGVIKILSPLEWIDDEEQLPKLFKEKGPIAHEYAHLLVDYKTNGNYPRWLTEGIAQYVEKELNGEVPFFDEKGVNWYSFLEMDRDFDSLENQSLAYWQSLLAVEQMVELGGIESILRILDELEKGLEIDEVLTNVLGENLIEFEKNLKEEYQAK